MTDISALPNSVRSIAVPTSTSYNSWLQGSTAGLFPNTPTPRLDLLNLPGLGCDQSWLARDRILEQNNEIHLQQQALLAETKALCQSLLSATNITIPSATLEMQSPTSLDVPKIVLDNNPAGLVSQTPDQQEFVLPTPRAPMAANMQASNVNKPPGIQYKRELFVPNDLIGCIIGRGGNKINEIRQTSQANIKISSGEEGELDRRITITGTLAAVQTAEKMINNRLGNVIPFHAQSCWTLGGSDWGTVCFGTSNRCSLAKLAFLHALLPNSFASIDLHKHLIALNMAMNSVYATKQSQLAQSHFSLSALTRKEKKATPSTSFSNFYDQVGHSLTPICPPIVVKQVHSAPSKLTAATEVQENFEMATTRTTRISSICPTPKMSVPVMSANQLKSALNPDMTSLPAVNSGVDAISNVAPTASLTREPYDLKEVLDLIRQLPLEDQQKWLVAFGLAVAWKTKPQLTQYAYDRKINMCTEEQYEQTHVH